MGHTKAETKSKTQTKNNPKYKVWLWNYYYYFFAHDSWTPRGPWTRSTGGLWDKQFLRPRKIVFVERPVDQQSPQNEYNVLSPPRLQRFPKQLEEELGQEKVPRQGPKRATVSEPRQAIHTHGRLAACFILHLILLYACRSVERPPAGGQDTWQQCLVQVHVQVEGPQH